MNKRPVYSTGCRDHKFKLFSTGATENAGLENAGVAQYGKPKSPLFNIVVTATSTNVNQKDFTHWNSFIV